MRGKPAQKDQVIVMLEELARSHAEERKAAREHRVHQEAQLAKVRDSFERLFLELSAWIRGERSTD